MNPKIILKYCFSTSEITASNSITRTQTDQCIEDSIQLERSKRMSTIWEALATGLFSPKQHRALDQLLSCPRSTRSRLTRKEKRLILFRRVRTFCSLKSSWIINAVLQQTLIYLEETSKTIRGSKKWCWCQCLLSKSLTSDKWKKPGIKVSTTILILNQPRPLSLYMSYRIKIFSRLDISVMSHVFGTAKISKIKIVKITLTLMWLRKLERIIDIWASKFVITPMTYWNVARKVSKLRLSSLMNQVSEW